MLDDFFDNIERIKYITVGERQYELHVTDPYGFWTIKFPKKEKAPEHLKGQYTSFSSAESALRGYINKLESVSSAKAS